jgi:hypothetical protein
VASPLAPGLAALPQGAVSAFASTQAAWRFLHNPRVTLLDLVAPLHTAARHALASSPAPYALVVHDWSIVNYHTHAAKTDQVLFSTGADRGYELASALLVDAATGDPVAPLELRLRTDRAVYTTRPAAPVRPAARLDEIAGTLRAIADLELPRPVVSVIDCEGDSVDHLRQWHRDRHRFLVRSDGTRTVRSQGRAQTLKQIAQRGARRHAFQVCRDVRYHGGPATQSVAEVAVVLDRPAYRRHGAKRRVIPGDPLAVRLVMSRIHDPAGRLLASWYLLTNVPAAVAAAEIALWYYWRWRIESFFKLLKSAGQQLEAWQQEGGAAIAQRLLVASMACVVVWQVARAAGPDADALRALLVRLSGRQMKWQVPFTEPALLAGLWSLLAMLEVLGHYDLDELHRLAGPLRRPPPAAPTDST